MLISDQLTFVLSRQHSTAPRGTPLKPRDRTSLLSSMAVSNPLSLNSAADASRFGGDRPRMSMWIKSGQQMSFSTGRVASGPGTASKRESQGVEQFRRLQRKDLTSSAV